MKRMRKIIISTILVTIGFLASVILYLKIKHMVWGGDAQNDNGYTSQQLIFAVLGECIRAYVTNWLYVYHRTDKSLLINAIKFGVICSALIGSIWLPLGMEFLNPQDKLSFLIDDGIILTLQGLVAGIVLWFMYNDEDQKFTAQSDEDK